MALDFPANPQTNDTYTASGTTWQWDGIAWTVIPSSGSVFPNSYGTVTANGITLTADASSDILNFLAGENVTLTTNTNTNTITISAADGGSVDAEFYIAADDSTQRLLSNGETLQFLGGTGITTATDTEGNVTITSTVSASSFDTLNDVQTSELTVDKVYESAIATLRVDNVGTSSYNFLSHYSGNNPTVYALAGTTIAFDLDGIPGHPFEIQNAQGDPYNVGLVHVAADGTVSTGVNAQGKDSGTLYWRIQESISGGYRYQCQNHAGMVGAITIKRLSVI